MHIQKSFDQNDGKLYVVPTPIGNLEDITFRALKTLRSVNFIAAEDTRNTKKLLHYFDINTQLISYHEYNKFSREKELLKKLQEGKSIALVSDAGMPAISDPGNELIQTAVQKNIPVIALPGANAALCALVGSGLATDEFLFYGFLPRKSKEKRSELRRLKSLSATIIFYESPHRIKQTLEDLYKQFGDRHIAIARELTKRYEEYIRGSLYMIKDWSQTTDWKGECCIIIQGIEQETMDDLWWSHLSVKEHVSFYIEQKHMRSNEAIKQVAQERRMKRNDVYKYYHKI